MRLIAAFAFCLLVPQITAVQTASAQDWAGPYAGGQLSWDNFAVEDRNYGTGPKTINGAGFGVFGGYNFQSGPWVYGPELQLTKHSAEGDVDEYFLPATIESSVGLRARVGYATGKTLPYLAIGAASTRWNADHEGLGNPADFGHATARGISVALGVDVAMQANSFLRIEVETTRYNDSDILFHEVDPHGYGLNNTRISVGYAIRF